MTISLSWHELPAQPNLFSKYTTDVTWRKNWIGADSFDDLAIQKRVEYLKSRKTHSKEISDILFKQNAIYDSHAVKTSLNKTKDKNCLYVITGQQPATFGGPLYNLYKAISVIRYAHKVEQMTNLPCVPLFWVAGNDFDIEEADAFYILNKNARIEKIPLKLRHGLTLDEVPIFEAHSQALSSANEKLWHSEFSSFAQEYFQVEEGQTLSQQFASFLMRFFHTEGLLTIEAKSLLPMSEPAFSSILKNEKEIDLQIKKNSQELNNLGYHAQVTTDSSNRFLAYQAHHGRKRITQINDDILINQQKIATTSDWLQNQNYVFTPDVLGRPLWQDMIFPTVAYIAGPGEISYFHQLKGCYEILDMQMPLILPRLSATFIEKKQCRFLDNMNLRKTEFYHLPTQIDIRAENLQKDSSLLELASKIWGQDLQDKQEKALFEKNLQKLRHIESKYYQKITSHRQNKYGVGSKQLAEARDFLLPLNKLQERVLGAYPFLCQHGPSFVDKLKSLPYKAGEHLIISLDDC